MPSDAPVGPDGVFGRPHRHIFGVAQRPAGKGARRLFDVVFGVVADAHAEELQQFAPPVFVDCAVVVLLIIKPDNHRRILGEVDEQVVQSAEPKSSEHLDLIEQRARLIGLSVAGGEYAVPEQRYLLFHRRFCGYHAVEPVCGGGVAVAEFVHIGVVALDDVVGHILRIAGMQQILYGGFVAQRFVVVKLSRGCAERRAAQQMLNESDIRFGECGHNCLPLQSIAINKGILRVIGFAIFGFCRLAFGQRVRFSLIGRSASVDCERQRYNSSASISKSRLLTGSTPMPRLSSACEPSRGVLSVSANTISVMASCPSTRIQV